MPSFRITSPDGRTFRVTAPEGTTHEEALERVQQQVAAQSGSTRERLKRENPGEYDPSSPEYQAKYGAVSGMSNVQRFAAGAGKATVDVGRGIRQLGTEGLDFITGSDRGSALRAEQDRIAALDAPLMDTGAGVAGAVTGTLATMIVPGAAAARGAQAANLARTAGAARALVNPATMRASLASGAAFGATQPVGTSESRTVNTAIGAATGGAARAVTGAVGAGVRAASRALEGAEKKAQRFIAEAIERDGLTSQEALERLASLGPNATLADLGEHVAGLARAATSKPGGARTAARDFLEERAAGQRERFIQTTGLGDVTEFKQSVRKFMTTRHSNAQALYKEAYEAPLDLSSPQMQELLNRPTMRAVMRAAERNLADEGGAAGHVRVMDAAKRALDDKVGAALRAGAKDKARRFSAMRNTLLAEVDRQVPQYGQARAIYAGEAAMRDAVQLGRNLFGSRKLDLDDAERIVQSMGEGELEAFQRGALRGLVDRLDAFGKNKDLAGELIDSPRAREILRLAFPDEAALERMIRAAESEATFARTRGAVLGARPRAALDEAEGLQEGVSIVSALARNDLPRASGLLLQRLGVGKASDTTLAAVSKAIFGRDVPAGPSRGVELGRRLGRAARSGTVTGSAAAVAVNQ